MSARSRLFAVPLLLLGALASAFGVIASTHACRDLYAELQNLEAERWYLEEEYSRLLLEQSTWASHHRIEEQAALQLGLEAPTLERSRVIVR